jgi:rhodanese-related sulfurtransferase
MRRARRLGGPIVASHGQGAARHLVWIARARRAAAVALLAIACAAFGGCASQSGAPAGEQNARAGAELDVAAARRILAERPEALVLDVRQPEEWNDDVGHIEGARLTPLPELPARMAEIEAWKEKPVLVVCRVGVRSAQAAELLAGAGFTDAHNVAGGMEAWRRAKPGG